MDAYQTIVTRRSIRKFLDRPIPPETLDMILEAAMQAPSAVNKQPWHFVVIDDRGLIEKIPEIHPHAQMTTGAPCAILVCGDSASAHGPGYIPQDCSAATQNMLLAAHALGLGSVWCGVFSRPEREEGFRSLLSLPKQIVPFSLVVLGYPDEQKESPRRFQAERIHRNGW